MSDSPSESPNDSPSDPSDAPDATAEPTTATPDDDARMDRPVTDAEISSAMAVDALPDQVRTHGFNDETDQTVTSAGELAAVEGDHLAATRDEG